MSASPPTTSRTGPVADGPILGGIADLPDDLDVPGPTRRLSIVVLATGLALVALGLLSSYNTFEPLLSATTIGAPGTDVVDLRPNDYVLYAETRSGDRHGSFEHSDVSVVDASTGQPVRVRPPTQPLLAAFNGKVYVSVGHLRVEDESRRLEVTIDSTLATSAVLAPSESSTIQGAGQAFSAFGIGALVTGGGIIMWITGVRRRRERAAELGIASYFERIPRPR